MTAQRISIAKKIYPLIEAKPREAYRFFKANEILSVSTEGVICLLPDCRNSRKYRKIQKYACFPFTSIVLFHLTYCDKKAVHLRCRNSTEYSTAMWESIVEKVMHGVMCDAQQKSNDKVCLEAVSSLLAKNSMPTVFTHSQFKSGLPRDDLYCRERINICGSTISCS